MTSFISSFKREGKVIAFLVVSLLAIEAAMRLGETSLSKDLATITSLPKVAASIRKKNDEGSRTVLFIGDSLVRDDIELSILQNARGTAADQVAYFKSMADATSLLDWYYIFKRYFVRSGGKPDVLAICFSKDDFADHLPMEPRRLSRYFCAWQDMSELLASDAKAFDDGFSILAAKCSSLFANRERIQLRATGTLIPNYRTTIQVMNRAALRRSWPTGKMGETSWKFNNLRFRRMLRLANAEQIELVFIAMGMPVSYEIDPGIVSLMVESELPLIDLRQVDGIQSNMFPDGLHMNDEAAGIFSLALANELATLGL